MANSWFDQAALKANTINGKGWLAKVLHPPGTKDPTYNGYPDTSTRPLVHQEYRLNFEDFKHQDNAPNDMLILHAPSILNVSFYSANNPGKSGAISDENRWALFQTNDQLSVPTMISEFGQYRPAYRSTTEQLDATAFNNAGMHYVAQISPSTYKLTLGQAIFRMASAGNLKDHAKLFASTFPDTTKYVSKCLAAFSNPKYDHDSPINHKNRVNLTEAEIDPDTLANLRASMTINNTTVQVVVLGRPILQPSDITGVSPKSYTARATEGAFIVNQINEPTNRWCNVGGGYVQKNNDNKGYICMYEYISPNLSSLGEYGVIVPFNQQSTTDFVYDVEWGAWSWALSYYTGLSASSSAGNPTINFKTVIGAEISPAVRSILNPNATAPALFDPTALETYAILSQVRQDGMPASFNAMGAILGALAPSLIGGGIKAVAQAIGGSDSTKAHTSMIEKNLANEASEANNEKSGVTNTGAMFSDPSMAIKPKHNGRSSMSMNDRFSSMSMSSKPTDRKSVV